MHQVSRHNSFDRQLPDTQDRALEQQPVDEVNNPQRQRQAEVSAGLEASSRHTSSPLQRVPQRALPGDKRHEGILSGQGASRQVSLGSSSSGQGLHRQVPLASSPTGQGSTRQVPLGSSPSGQGLSKQVPLGSSPSGQGLPRQGSSGQPVRRHSERRLASERASLEAPSHSQVIAFACLAHESSFT